jgi:GNAT superfamily N-acetyltransferase
MIRLVTESDIDGWLELAREVEPLFGEMAGNEDFINGVKGCIGSSSALCAAEGNDIEGVVAFSRAENEICWLAVRERSRSKGYGRELLQAALSCLDSKRPVAVQTFSAGIEAGEAARKLYTGFGFKDYKDAGANPAGINTVIMKREPRQGANAE